MLRPCQRSAGADLSPGGSLAAALPIAHELIPHQGVHNQLAAAFEGEHALKHTDPSTHAGAGHTGVVGTVDPAVNGFDPAEHRPRLRLGQDPAHRGRGDPRVGRSSPRRRRSRSRPGVKYAAWTYNGRVPGPTLRANEGDRLRVNFTNASPHPHTMHFHGIHRDTQDGVPGVGPGNIEPGHSHTYEFNAEPFGLHLYHCHSTPLADHIAKGLYGAFIIDPKQGRPEADELILVMNGFDTNFDRSNEVYARQHRRLRLHAEADPGEARPARPDLRGERARVRPPQQLPHPRELLPPLPDRHLARADRVHGHDRPGPGPARHPGAALPLHRAVHVPRARVANSRSSAGWASSRSPTDWKPAPLHAQGLLAASPAGSPG